MIKALIFDCFGVIRPDSMVMAYQKLGGDYEADRTFIEETQRAANLGLIEGSRYAIAERLGVSVEAWMRMFDADAGVDQELLDFIEVSRKEYKTAILSNASKGRLAEVVGQSNLQRCFDAVVESGSVGFAKPDPEIFEYTADQLGVRYDECLFTDDREEYCDAARTVGMQTICYSSFKQYKSELLILL